MNCRFVAHECAMALSAVKRDVRAVMIATHSAGSVQSLWITVGGMLASLANLKPHLCPPNAKNTVYI